MPVKSREDELRKRAFTPISPILEQLCFGFGSGLPLPHGGHDSCVPASPLPLSRLGQGQTSLHVTCGRKKAEFLHSILCYLFVANAFFLFCKIGLIQI